MRLGTRIECPCGAWVIWGALATDGDFAAWNAEHDPHARRDPTRIAMVPCGGVFVTEHSAMLLTHYLGWRPELILGRVVQLVVHGEVYDVEVAHRQVEGMKAEILEAGAREVEATVCVEATAELATMEPPPVVLRLSDELRAHLLAGGEFPRWAP